MNNPSRLKKMKKEIIDQPRICPSCFGKGKKTSIERRARMFASSVQTEHTSRCWCCLGTGYIYDFKNKESKT